MPKEVRAKEVYLFLNLQIGYVYNFVTWVVWKSRHTFLKKKEKDRKGKQLGYQVSPEKAKFLMVMTMVMVVQAGR